VLETTAGFGFPPRDAPHGVHLSPVQLGQEVALAHALAVRSAVVLPRVLGDEDRRIGLAEVADALVLE
jgi:hypothetical protein